MELTTLDTTAIKKLLNFLHTAEKLKSTLRHGWTSTGRQESVADHSWRLSLLLILIEPHLSQKIDMERALKIAVTHDLVEAITGDIPYFEAPPDSLARAHKKLKEQQAIEQITSLLDDPSIQYLWEEYESKATLESQIVNALDKIEAQIQQNEAPPSTCLPQEISDAINGHISPQCTIDPAIQTLSQLTVYESRNAYNH